MALTFSSHRLSEFAYLSSFRGLFADEIRLFHESSHETTRHGFDGVTTLAGKIGDREGGLVYCDFRVNGGSFSPENSERIRTFLETMTSNGSPVIFWLNSIGVRLTAGRSTFHPAFSIYPAALEHSRSQLLVTVAAGQCLGLAAAIYGLGHLRLAVQGSSHLCLTGPDVIKQFFGARDDTWDLSSAESLAARNGFVHEALPDSATLTFRLRDLIRTIYAPTSRAKGVGTEFGDLNAIADVGRESARILDAIGARELELIPGLSPKLRLFLMNRNGRRFGLFLNPPERADNTIDVPTMRKYAEGLTLFARLGVPVVSALDSPGVDPRAGNHGNILESFNLVAEKIIHYPHAKLGVCIGRGYGGSNSLGFPKVFGSDGAVVLKGAKIGFMDPTIARSLFQSSPRLLEEWERGQATELEDYSDLLKTGNVQAVVDLSELGTVIEDFLARHAPRSR